MNDNDLIMLYDIVKDLELNDEQQNLVNRLSIIVEQVNLSHEYRDKLQELNKKLQGCDNNANE